MLQKKSSIRKSRDQDVEDIYKWLVAENERGEAGNFLCNWNLTKEQHKEGRLFVYFCAYENIAVAYQWGELLSPGIMQVKKENRGKGIGSKLVRSLIKKAQKSNNDILRIDCKPSSSIPFWRKMGFELYSDDRSAFRILNRKLTKPVKSDEVVLKVSFYPERAIWDDSTKAAETHRAKGWQCEDGRIYLAYRINFYPYQYKEFNSFNDLVVKIEVNNKEVYKGKAKYPKAYEHGMRGCKNGWYFDQILSG
jgi:GNAT superfamily N-acetyltransferase